MRDILHEPGVCHLAAGELEAIFLPERGMLGASLRHRGEELLRKVEDLDSAARKGSTAGIPLLHPWANRLAGLRYAVAGREVELSAASPLLHYDGNGLPMHGVPWALLNWEVTHADDECVAARLDWDRPELLEVFPFRHRLEMTVKLGAEGLTVETTLMAGDAGPVPVSFGFHPYLGLPGVARSDWRLTLPKMRHLALDERGIPMGASAAFDGCDGPLGTQVFDDGFALEDEGAILSIAGGGRHLGVELVEGFRYTQVFAPEGQDLIALEPMTAPANALASGEGLRLVAPGQFLRTVFRIRVSPTE